MRRKKTWHEEHTEKLSAGDRAADIIRNGMGSWRFVGYALLFLAGWIVGVTVYHLPIDNPQLTILNLGLSCLAALQGSILLIAARRQDAIAAKLAQYMLEVELESEKRIETLQRDLHRVETEKLDLLLKHHGIPVPLSTPAPAAA